jgi:competence protein ComGF
MLYWTWFVLERKLLKTKKQKNCKKSLTLTINHWFLYFFQNKRVGEVIHIWKPIITPHSEKLSLHKDGNTATPQMQGSRSVDPAVPLCLRRSF